MAASEAVPYSKTGGLADVAGALPKELAKLGHNVVLIIPGYRCNADSGRDFHPIAQLPVTTPQGTVNAVISEDVMPIAGHPTGVRVWAVQHDAYFDRSGLYQEKGKDYPDNLERFVFFSRAIIEAAAYLQRDCNWQPDLLHLHDWQTSLCAVYLKTIDGDRAGLRNIKTVLTLHNVGYQGIFPGGDFTKTGLPSSLFGLGGVEFYGSLNLLKGGIIFSDLLTTVSPTYGREILTPEGGFGLDGVLKSRAAQLKGIVNGIDIDVWNPETDPFLPATYSAKDRSGKQLCKQAIQREFKLPVMNLPLLAVIGRMASQKGFDLIESALPQLMKLDVQMVMLGTGDPHYESSFKSLQARYPTRLGLHIGFDEGLAHRIEAGADMLIMPSKYEPCGLTQLSSLRYGTVPVVTKTGGLADTVVPLSGEANHATGFFINPNTDKALFDTIGFALDVYRDRSRWEQLMDEGMNVDVSWVRSANEYSRLFTSTILGSQ